MKTFLVIVTLLILAGCETYSVGGTVRPADNVQLYVGVESGYYHPYYYHPYYYHPRPVYIYRRPVIIHQYSQPHYRNDRRHDHDYDDRNRWNHTHNRNDNHRRH